MRTRLGLFFIGLTAPLFSKEITWEFHPAFLETAEIQGGSWSVIKALDHENLLELSASDPVPKKPVRRPANILWLAEDVDSPFEFNIEVKTLVPEVKGADVCILFEDSTGDHLVYLHLSNDSDGRVHQVIMHVNLKEAIRTPIQHQAKPKTMLSEGWNPIRVTVDRKGVVSVFSGNEENPSMTALLPSIPIARLGVGSFNDPAQFKNLRLEIK